MPSLQIFYLSTLLNTILVQLRFSLQIPIIDRHVMCMHAWRDLLKKTRQSSVLGEPRSSMVNDIALLLINNCLLFKPHDLIKARNIHVILQKGLSLLNVQESSLLNKILKKYDICSAHSPAYNDWQFVTHAVSPRVGLTFSCPHVKQHSNDETLAMQFQCRFYAVSTSDLLYVH